MLPILSYELLNQIEVTHYENEIIKWNFLDSFEVSKPAIANVALVGGGQVIQSYQKVAL